MKFPDSYTQLTAALADRILILDGAMGTLIQSHKLSEKDFRSSRFKDHTTDLAGNNDLLTLTADTHYSRYSPAIPGCRGGYH